MARIAGRPTMRGKGVFDDIADNLLESRLERKDLIFYLTVWVLYHRDVW